ncbi:hypothetical protein P7C70_g7765, partial [Phenoliferia sp. Uapishka_3]
MMQDETTSERDSSQTAPLPSPSVTATPPRTCECGSMMLSVRSTTENIDATSEAADIAVAPVETSDLEPTYEDWINEEYKRIFESKESPPIQFRHLHAREGDIIVDESQSKVELVQDLGLQSEGSELLLDHLELLEGPGEEEEELESDDELVSNMLWISEDITYEMLSDFEREGGGESDDDMYL